MRHHMKPVIFLVLLALLHVQFPGSAAKHRHGHNHHSHLTSEELNLIKREIEDGEHEGVSNEDDQEPIYIPIDVPIKSSEDNDDENSNSVEDRVSPSSSSVANRFGLTATFLCLEDEEDIERRIRHLGVKCICPEIRAPVCGSDGVTYHNRCMLKCHATQALLNYHRHRITLRKFGPC